MNDRVAHQSREASGDARRTRIICEFTQVIESIARSNLKVFSRELATHGITVLQYHALRSIAIHGSEVDMSSIATMTGLSASSITSIIDRLDQRGLVVREHDAGDRRRVVATITEAGTALLQRIEADELEKARRIFDGISNEDLQACLDVFRRADARMVEMSVTGKHA